MSFREIDVLWESMEPYLPPQKPHTGRPRANMRKADKGRSGRIQKEKHCRKVL
jgi:putative transposase